METDATTPMIDDWDRAMLAARLRSVAGPTAVEDARTGHVFGALNAQDRLITVFMADRFIGAVQKDRLFDGRRLWQTFRNVRYGYDPARAQSSGGRDGVFKVDESFRERNSMVVTLYERFARTPRGGSMLAALFGDATRCHGVRIVSHVARLLGFIGPSDAWDRLLLVDVDIRKRG